MADLDTIDQFFTKVQEISDIKHDVFVVSDKKEVKCSSISFKQQKDLIATIADGVAGAVLFQKSLNNIVVSNTNLNNLKITDRLAIVLKLRSDSFGNIVNVDGKPESISEAIQNSQRVNYVYSSVIEDNGLVVELEIPTIKYENSIIDVCISSLKKEKSDNFGSQLNTIYTYEIIKFIKSIKFGENCVDYYDLSVPKRVEIIEKLPMTLNRKILTFIQKIKDQENEIKKTNNGSSFEIDVSFFDS